MRRTQSKPTASQVAANFLLDDELGLERDIAQALTESDSMANALTLLLRRICETVGWDYGQAWLPAPSNRVMRISTAWHSEWKPTQDGVNVFEALHRHTENKVIKRNSGLVGTAWTRREAVWLPDASGDLGWVSAQEAPEYAVGAGLAIPVIFNKRVAVVLEFLSREKRSVDRRMTFFVSALASRLTTVIQREYDAEALRRSEEWFRAAAEGSLASFFILHAVKASHNEIRDFKFVYINERAENFFHFARGSVVGKRLVDVFPRRSADPLLVKALHVLETQQSLEEEMHLPDHAGTDVWLRTQIVPIGNGVAVTMHDVSRRKRAEQAVRESEDRFRALIDHASDIITVLDNKGIIRYESPSVQRILGWSADELVGKSAFDYIHPGDRERVVDLFYLLRSKPGVTPPIRLRFRCHKDVCGTDWKPLELIANNLLHQEKIDGIVINSRDISDQVANERRIRAQQRALERANRRLSELATTDGLTRIKNQRAFREQLEQEWRRTQRYGQPLSLVVLDIDYFKRFNDEIGHQHGDKVLIQVAEILTRETRSTDFVARYGGEEFVILMPNTPAPGAVIGAERIRVAIENAAWEKRAVTASFGIATLMQENFEVMDDSSQNNVPFIASSDALFSLADQALYASKHAGRNRVTHIDQTLPQKPQPQPAAGATESAGRRNGKSAAPTPSGTKRKYTSKPPTIHT